MMLICSKTIVDERELEDRVKKGFNAVEILVEKEWENPKRISEILNSFDKIKLVIIHIPQTINNKIFVYGCPKKILETIVEFAENLDCKVYEFTTIHFRLFNEKTKNKIELLNKYLKIFEYRLSLENLMTKSFLPINNVMKEVLCDINAEKLLFLARSNNCGITLDTAHLWVSELFSTNGNSENALKKFFSDLNFLSERTKIIHFADSTDNRKITVKKFVEHDNLPIGKGTLPVKKILEKIKKTFPNISEIPIVTEVNDTDYYNAVNQLKAKEILEKFLL